MSDDFSDLMSAGGVAAGLQVQGKRHLFQALGRQAATLTGLDADLIADRIGDRERLGSTGFGRGVAIPHGKVPDLAHVTGLFVRLATPIDFRAIDDLPVDLVFLLLSPEDAGVEHLKALARVSRRMRDAAFLAKLRGAANADALYALLATSETRHAA